MRVRHAGLSTLLVVATATGVFNTSQGSGAERKTTVMTVQAAATPAFQQEIEVRATRASRDFSRSAVSDSAPTSGWYSLVEARAAAQKAEVVKLVAVRAKAAAAVKVKAQAAAKAKTAAAKAKKKTEGGQALPAILVKIRTCESGNGQGSYSYQADNPYSTASGAFQFLDSTWRYVSGLSGKARHYSRTIQDKYAMKLYRSEGTRPWRPSRHCWG